MDKKFFSAPSIIFVILGVIILIELISAIRTLTSPVPLPPPSPSTKTSKLVKGTMSLNAAKTNVRVNEVIPVSVMVDTGSHTIGGVDLIVHFDPKFLEATQGGLIKGKIFNDYPLVSLDVKKGLISISGISSSKNTFTGTGQFALINFKAKLSGKTSLTIDFKPGSTTASNLVDVVSSKNILEQIYNLELNIQ